MLPANWAGAAHSSWYCRATPRSTPRQTSRRQVPPRRSLPNPRLPRSARPRSALPQHSTSTSSTLSPICPVTLGRRTTCHAQVPFLAYNSFKISQRFDGPGLAIGLVRSIRTEMKRRKRRVGQRVDDELQCGLGIERSVGQQYSAERIDEGLDLRREIGKRGTCFGLLLRAKARPTTNSSAHPLVVTGLQ